LARYNISVGMYYGAAEWKKLSWTLT
jgi:hypothetical protein